MTTLQITITLVVFGTVILAIAFDVIDMAVAALLGVSALVALGIMDRADLMAGINTASGPLLLLSGGMVVAHTLGITGLFDRISATYLRATRGSGKRFLLLLVALVAPLCAILPNATTVVLLAPVIIRVATALEIDIVGPLILTAIVSNSAGLLTLVGDPATFMVGSAIGMTFVEYLQRVSLGGLVSLLVVLPLLPVLMRDVWRVRRDTVAEIPETPLERPGFAVLSIVILVTMVFLFMVGELLPSRIAPPAAAFIAASLALLVVNAVRVSTIENVMREIDWKTLVFLAGIFCLVQAVTETGLLQSLALRVYEWFGAQLRGVSMALLAGIGFLSSVLANTPVVAASLTMVKGYLVAAELVPELALGAAFDAWPTTTLPVFIAMMFGATLGGNATLVGASANLVAVGAAARNGRQITFLTWMRFGVPFTIAQLLVSAVYVLALYWVLG